MYVGLLHRAQLIIPYKLSHSSALRDLNMMLLVVFRIELAVGGERMLISNAVPRRNGTIGVSSNATSGCWSGEELRSPESSVSPSPGALGPECAADILNASISPGDTTIEHSSGCSCSHMPLSDHAQIVAMVLDFSFLGTVVDEGTLLYGPCEAESDGASVRVPLLGGTVDGGGLATCDARRLPAVTATKGVGMSLTSDMKSSDVSDELSLASSESDSAEDSDAVDGAYSCLSGDDDRRWALWSDFGVGLS